MADKLRIFLADDHGVVREGLKSLVEREPDMEVVGEAANGQQAVDMIAGGPVDVAVLDLSMPELNGIKAIQWLAEHCPSVKVVALTVHEDKGYLQWALKGGACGYVLKRSAPDQLITAIREVAAGRHYVDPAMTSKLQQDATGQEGEFTVAGASRGRDLSSREMEVAQLVVQGFSNKEIAKQLEISVKTVETHKNRLMEKLQLRSRAELVRFALTQGWMASV